MTKQQQLRYHGIVLGEIMEMTRVMRQNRKWRSSPNGPIENDSWLLQGFQNLRSSLIDPNGISPEFDRLQIIKPFVAAVRSEEATGPITGAALSSLHKFISANLFAMHYAYSAAAILEIADAGTHCRFEATDSGNDELVLMKILQVHLSCFSVENGALLTDTTVWEMVQTCFRIYRQMNPPEYSQLLSDRARHSLFEMIRLIFSLQWASRDAISLRDDSKVHETNVRNISQHFGIACMVKVLGSLISMGRSSLIKTQMFGQRQQTVLVLQLTLNALEFGGTLFEQDKALLGLIQDDLCFFLLQNSRSARSSVMSLVTRLFHCILVNFRHLLRTQIESILNTIFLGCRDSPYEIREIILSTLLDLAHYPWFFRELYVNYDCSPRATNVFENIVLFLCDFSVPPNGHINSNNVLAMRCLQVIMQSFVDFLPKSYPSFNVAELLSSKKQKTAIFNCVSLFNKKPKLGFTALTQAGIMDSMEDCETAAQILFHTPIVNKAALGEFLGSPSSFASEVRSKFISYFDFRGKDVVEALRVCLEGFRLPAEAQQIDRIVQSFSDHYYSHNNRDFANADVIHILTFALIMLNTDAHNDGIKHKMTLEQFTKNLRGINNGESFPDEFLENLYKSIVLEELKISKSGPGGDFSRSLWTELLAKSRNFDGQVYLELAGSALDGDIFRLIWEPVCSAISLLFDVGESERVSELCLSTFESIGTASCTHQLSETVDTIVSFCCQVSGLLHPENRLEDTVIAISRSRLKSQASIRLIFYQPFINNMHGSWNLWICVLYQLLRLGLLPPAFFILDDFVYSEITDPARRRLIFPDYVQKPVSLQSLLTSVQNFWMSSNDMSSSDTKSVDQIESAKESAQAFVEQLNIEELLMSTTSMPSESFVCLVNALTFVTKEDMLVSSSDSTVIIDEKTQFYRSFPRLETVEELVSKQVIFFLQLLTRLLIINRDRSNLCLDIISSHLYQLFRSQFSVISPAYFEPFSISSSERLDSSDDLAEAVVVASLQLFLKFRCHNSSWFPSFLLKLLVGFDIFGHVSENIGKQVAFALHILSQTDAALLRPLDDWTNIFTLLQGCAACSSGSGNGFEALACLLSNQNCNAFSESTVILCIQTALKFIQSKAVPVGERLRAIDYLQLIFDRLFTLNLSSRSVVDTEEPEVLLVSYHMQIFEALRVIICSSEKFSLREHALSTLQRLLLSSEARTLPTEVWKEIFDKIIINMITVLGLTRSSSHYLSKCRCAVTAFACRVFLIYLTQLLTLDASKFKALWCSLLSELLRFFDLESDNPSHSLLAETVTESLKNTLRVMSASDIEESFGADLWEITWQTIDPFLPQLREEVAPREDELPLPDESKPDPKSPAPELVISNDI